MADSQAILKKLGLSDSEINIYLALATGGSMSASELTRATQTKRPTAYYALRQLLDRGLVHKSGNPGVERFQAEKPERLLRMITLREQELKALEKEVQAMLPSLEAPPGPGEGLPAVSFHEGPEAMKQVIMETVYCRSGEIDYLTPHDNFFWQAGQAFSANYVQDRARRGIKTRHLWEQPLDKELIRQYPEQQSKIRLLPESMKGRFRSTILLYDDKVMYVSSKKSGYVLLVKSIEHHELMKAMYDQLWEISKKSALNRL